MTRAAIYCRISNDAAEAGEGVERQEQDCRRKAASEGLEVVSVYVDNDISASTLSGTPRPQFDSMLADAGNDFEVILAYSNSRLTRRPAELETLIKLNERTGVAIRTVVSGDDDLATADGRMVARIKASVDAAEAERTAERARRAAKQRAELGRVKRGRYRTFGYTDDFQIIEDEAEVIRDAFSRIIQGQSIQSIAELWRSTGVTMGNGKDVHHSTVKNIVSRHLYAGLSTYKGEVVGKAQVEPIVDEAVFNAAQIRLQSNSKPMGKNARRYLLTGLVACSECLVGMSGNPGRESATQGYKHVYTCKKVLGGCGKQNVDGVYLEAMALALVRQNLIVHQKPQPLTDYSAPLAEVQRQIDAVKAARDSGDIDVIDAIDLMRPLTQQRKDLERQAAQQIIETEDEGFRDWEAFCEGSLSQQKATVARVIKQIVVKPAGGRQWNPDRAIFYLANNTVPGSAVWQKAQQIEPRLVVDGFRDKPELLNTKGNKPKRTETIKVNGRFMGSRPLQEQGQ